MSFYTDASLVLIPSGIKDQKVYCAKPVDGTGDLSFSRASNATRVNSSGLVEKVRTNLLTYSQDFGNAAWSTNNSAKTTSQTDPNGGTTAVKIVSTANVNSGIYQTKTASSTTRTASLWMKGELGGEVVEYGDATNRATATLTTSWVRYSFAATDATAFFVIYNQTSAPVVQTWYVAFAQYEDGDIATDYIPTTSAAVSVGPVSGLPRLDYSGGASCPSLLLEPQRSNVVLFSEQIDNAAWTKDGSTCTANQTTSPSGYVDADLITNNGGAADHSVYQQYALSASTAYSVSAYVKKGTEQYVFFALNYGANSNEWATATFNLDAGTSGNYSNLLSAPTSTITSVGNDWYRVTMTATTATTGTHILIIGFGKAGAPDTSRGRYIANNTNTFYLWGCQLEQGAYATSYIPTLSSAVTRVADSASKTGISSLIGQTEGTLYGEFSGIEDATEYPNLTPTVSDGTNNNRIMVYHDPSGSGAIYVRVVVSGTSIINLSVLSAPTYQSTNKIAIAYKANNYAVYFNGTQIYTNTSAGAPPVCSKVDLFNNALSSNFAKVEGKQALLFKTRLSNSSLASLTTL